MSGVTLFAVDRSTRHAFDGVAEELGVEWGRRAQTAITLLDTFDGRLHAAGLQLRLVSGGGSHLVLSGAGDAAQPWRGRALPGAGDDLPPGPVAEVIRPFLGGRALVSLGVVTSSRRAAVVEESDGSPSARLALHTAVRVDGRPATKDDLLEVSAAPGGRRRTRKVIAELERLGLQVLEGDVVNAALAGAGGSLAGFENFPVVPLAPDMTAADGFRAVLARLALTIEANWDGTIARLDTEYLHDFRVAIRRTRTVLASGKQVLPDSQSDAARVGLGWLATQTSVTCDLDVYVIEWDRYTAGLDESVIAALAPLRQLLCERLDESYAHTAAALDSPQARAMIVQWRDWLEHSHSDVGDLGLKPLGATVAQLVIRSHRILVQRGRLITPETPAAQVHDLRKDAKRLRYLLECFGSLMPPDAQRRFVKRLKVLQDNLGEHQDAEVHVLQLAEFAHELQQRGAGADVLLAIGRLTERQDGRRSAARRAFADRFADYDTKATTKALFEVTDQIG